MSKRKRATKKYDSSLGEEEYFGVCEKCGKDNQPGLLILCDGEGCESSCHTFCCDPKLSEVPKGDWFCGECRSGNTEQHYRKVMRFCVQVVWDCIVELVKYIIKHQRLQCPPMRTLKEVAEQLQEQAVVKDQGPYDMLDMLGLSEGVLDKSADMYGKLKQTKHFLYEALLTMRILFKFGVLREPLTHAYGRHAFDMLLTDVSNHCLSPYHLNTFLPNNLMKEWEKYQMGPASDLDEKSSDDEDEAGPEDGPLQLAVNFNIDPVDEELRLVIADSQALVKGLQVNSMGEDRVVKDDKDFLVEVAKVKMVIEDMLPLKHRLILSDVNMAALFRAKTDKRQNMSEEQIWCIETLKFCQDELCDEDWAKDVIQILQEFCAKFATAS